MHYTMSSCMTSHTASKYKQSVKLQILNTCNSSIENSFFLNEYVIHLMMRKILFFIFGILTHESIFFSSLDKMSYSFQKFEYPQYIFEDYAESLLS